MEKPTKIYKVNYKSLDLDLEIFEVPYKVMKEYLKKKKEVTVRKCQ